MPRIDSRILILLGAAAVLGGCSASQQDEEQLGRENAAQVDSELPILHDSVVDHFLTGLGRRLTSVTERRDLAWQFAVVNTAQLNAFSLPGGYIYINRGTIEQSDQLDQLTGVIGHEIGHVVRRHSVKQLQKAEQRDVRLVLLCTLTRACSSVGGAVAVKVGADAMSAHYSQHDESEADSEAVVINIRAGYDPQGLPAFLEKLLAEEKEKPPAVEAIFATHPTDQSRIRALDRQIARQGNLRERRLLRDMPEFQAIRARLRALPAPQTVVAGAP